MVEVIQEEIWTFGILDTSVKNVRAELVRQIAARDSYIKLLEIKYNAMFNLATGQLEEKPAEVATP